MHGDLHAFRDSALEPHPGPLGQREPRDPARRGHEALGGILRVDPALDARSALRDLLLRPRQRLPGRDAELGRHQVEPGHLLGHRMLHLQARVHLEEVELVALDDELHGPRVHVAHRAGPRHRGLGEPGLQGRGQVGRGALLDQLLVPALDRALALVEMHHAAARVAEDLDLDVARRLEEALHEQGARAEGGLGASLGGREGGGQARLVLDPHHADAAAARRRLDHHRIADPARDLPGGLDRVHGPVAARHHRHARARHEPARADLVAHLLDHPPRRPDEDQPGRLAGLGEAPVLGEEAVAGMDGLGVACDGPRRGCARRRDSSRARARAR